MSDAVIIADRLGKRYRIGGSKAAAYATLREEISGAAAACVRPLARLLGRTGRASGNKRAVPADEFWALRDVSFEVPQGEVLGVVGRNGAGKSTLLKILSRITKPTEGTATVRGRVGSLVEVGTGFHPELSGRENIYLNGAILGMTRREIQQKFHEIVAFAEVERFIDMPVKRYSSGMYLRLAFGVAAHLEPEILLVDEVLAVGDAAFQRKCLNKMGDVSRHGRTVIFVSHNLAAVQNLCTRALLLERGRLAAIGPTGQVLTQYLAAVSQVARIPVEARTDRTGAGEVRVTAVEFLDADGQAVDAAACGQDLAIRVHYRARSEAEFRHARLNACVLRETVPAFHLSTAFVDTRELTLTGEGYVDFVIPQLPLTPSVYHLDVHLETNRVVQDFVRGAAELSVVDGDYYGTGKAYPGGWQGTGVLINYYIRTHEDRSLLTECRDR